MEAYQAALSSETAPRIEIGAKRTVPGTVNDLVVAYLTVVGARVRGAAFIGEIPLNWRELVI